MLARGLAVTLSLCATAAADPTLHAGLDIRTDLGTHPVRVPLGVRQGAWDGTIVADPAAVLDGEHDLDVLGEWFAGPRIALMFGWRWTAIHVADGTLHQQRSLIGVTGIGPQFFSGHLRTSASLELATLWVKHGAGTDTEWIAGDRNLLDHFALGLFVRVDVAN